MVEGMLTSASGCVGLLHGMSIIIISNLLKLLEDITEERTGPKCDSFHSISFFVLIISYRKGVFFKIAAHVWYQKGMKKEVRRGNLRKQTKPST